VFGPSQNLAEATQRQAGPVIMTSGEGQCLLWTNAYHMQMPLDIAENNSYVIVSFERRVGDGRSEVLSWQKFVIDKSSIESGVMSKPMKRPPIVGDDSLVDEGQFQRMDVEVVISKRSIG